MSQSLQPLGAGPLSVLERDVYVARRNFFNFLGITCRILDESEGLLAHIKLKAFKLREEIGVFADEAQTQPLLGIRARQIFDIGATYDVTDKRTGEVVGALRRKGLKSILKDEWDFLAADGTPIGRVEEDSWFLSLLRRFLAGFIPQNYHFYFGPPKQDPSQAIGEVRGTWNPFLVKFTVDLSRDRERRLDRRLALAAAVLLMTVEGKQE
jgi:hypothetical protein